MNQRVEFIYDQACPNVERARAALMAAFYRAGLSPRWMEWDSADPDGPAYAKAYGSPTILVDGSDIAGVAPGEEGASCRLYEAESGSVRGVPPVATIAAALRAKATTRAGGQRSGAPRTPWFRALAIAPGAGLSLLPVGVCPACLPAYAGLLSSFGLGFLLESTYLLPLTAGFFFIALVSLAYGARARHGYGPTCLGLTGAAVALGGKFVLSADPLLYVGLALIVGASLWNAWPRKTTSTGGCGKCASQPSGDRKTKGAQPQV